MSIRGAGVLVLLAMLLGACARSRLPVDAQVGPDPTLPAQRIERIPTVDIAPAVGWPTGTAPTPAPGLRVTPFAAGLDHPRWLLVLPDGDVLVAETNAPPRAEGRKGIKGRVMKALMKRAGAAVPSANRVTRLRDADGDGVAEQRSVFLEGLNSPFGMALVGEDFYVANTDAILRFPLRPGAARPEGAGERVVALPAGPRNHHWTKGLVASPDGRRLFVTVGSNSNVAEHGLAEEEGRAMIHVVDLAEGSMRPFATGLRNPNGLDFEPHTGVLWTTVNERDALGPDLVPDYLTSVRDGDFFGWPWSYFGAHVDPRVVPLRPDRVAAARVPDYALGSHVAALGLAFVRERTLGDAYVEGAFVGLHGSWNRRPPSGYAVVFVPFAEGRPSGKAHEVLGGFLDEKGNARGRPVGVALMPDGALLVADDVGNAVWRVAKR